MKKHAIIFASLALSCLVLSAPLSAGAVSSSQTEASSLYIITVQPELPVTERSELELTALEMTQTWQNPNPRRQLALKSVSRAGCSVYFGGCQRPCHGTGPRQGSHQCIHHAGRNADLHRNGHFRNWQSHAGCRRSFAAQHRQPAGPDPHCGCTGTFRCGTAMDKL